MVIIKNEIKKIAVSAIFSALIVAMILFGTFAEVFDITVAAICTFGICIILFEAKFKYALLTYITSSILGFIFAPLSSALLYFVFFFGYYPIFKFSLRKLPKLLRKILGILLFNTAMVLLLLLFKAVFAMTGEPAYMYVLLIATLNVIFLCLDYLLDIFPIIYTRKLRNKIKFMFR